MDRREFLASIMATAAFTARFGAGADIDDLPLLPQSEIGDIRAEVAREIIAHVDANGGIAPPEFGISFERWARLYDSFFDPPSGLYPILSRDGSKPNIMVLGVPVVVA